MKFKSGNLLKHTKSGGLWIVIRALPINKKVSSVNTATVFKMQLDAVCVQPGKSTVNYPGGADTWFFQEEDGSDHSDNWTVINEI